MAAESAQNFGAVAVSHRLRHKITDSIGRERVSPKHLNVRRLVEKVRLMRQHDGHQPIGIPAFLTHATTSSK
jgi:hypothetical protein